MSLAQQLRKFRRRERAGRWSMSLGRAIFVGAAAAMPACAFGWPVAVGAWAGCVGVGAIWALVARRPTDLELAEQLDGHFGLKELLASAVAVRGRLDAISPGIRDRADLLSGTFNVAAVPIYPAAGRWLAAGAIASAMSACFAGLIHIQTTPREGPADVKLATADTPQLPPRSTTPSVGGTKPGTPPERGDRTTSTHPGDEPGGSRSIATNPSPQSPTNPVDNAGIAAEKTSDAVSPTDPIARPGPAAPDTATALSESPGPALANVPLSAEPPAVVVPPANNVAASVAPIVTARPLTTAAQALPSLAESARSTRSQTASSAPAPSSQADAATKSDSPGPIAAEPNSTLRAIDYQKVPDRCRQRVRRFFELPSSSTSR